MREGTLWIPPPDGRDLGQTPLRFRQDPLIVTGLGRAPGFLQQRAYLGLVLGLLDRQDCQAVEGQTDHGGQLVLPPIGDQLFIDLLGLLPGTLEGIGLPQVGIEALDLPGLQHALPRRVLLEQGTPLFIVPDGVVDGKDGHGFIPGLDAVATGLLRLPRRPRMICQLGGPRPLAGQHGQSLLVQDLPPGRAQLGVDHFAHQLMRETIVGRPTEPGFLLPQDATLDGFLQGLNAGLHPELDYLPQAPRARRGGQHGSRHHHLAGGRREPGQAGLDHRAHRGR